MPLPCILGGFETPPKSFFFSDFYSQGTKGGQGKIGKKNWDKLPKFGIIDYRWSISYRSPPITEISLIFRSKFWKFCSLLVITYEETNQVKDSSDDEDDNEVSNMCFMALEDQDEVNSNSDDEELMYEYDELLKFIYKLDEKNTLLKKKVFELQKELDEIKENFSKVEASKISLKKENEELLKKNE